MKDKSPRMRVQAIRASETLYKAGDKSFADDYRALTKDADQNVVIQAMLTANLFKLPDAADVIKAAQAASKAKGVALVGERLLDAGADELRRRPARSAHPGRGEAAAAGERRLRRRLLRLSRHRRHGEGAGGRACPGTMMAPPLAGSPRVQAHRDYVIKVLLQRAHRSARRQDVSATSWCRWAAHTTSGSRAIASYVRNSFGNSAGMVTPADVARVRAETADSQERRGPFPSSKPRCRALLDAQQWKLTASHGAETAAGAASLRGWSSGAPQAPACGSRWSWRSRWS